MWTWNWLWWETPSQGQGSTPVLQHVKAERPPASAAPWPAQPRPRAAAASSPASVATMCAETELGASAELRNYHVRSHGDISTM